MAAANAASPLPAAPLRRVSRAAARTTCRARSAASFAAVRSATAAACAARYPASPAADRGISEATLYNWKAKYGGMDVSDAKRLRSLEEENRKLKKLLAESILGVRHG
jgi:hypothetical protein